MLRKIGMKALPIYGAMSQDKRELALGTSPPQRLAWPLANQWTRVSAAIWQTSGRRGLEGIHVLGSGQIPLPCPVQDAGAGRFLGFAFRTAPRYRPSHRQIAVCSHPTAVGHPATAFGALQPPSVGKRT